MNKLRNNYFKMITIKIKKEDYERLKEQAKREGAFNYEIFHKALKNYLIKRGKWND